MCSLNNFVLLGLRWVRVEQIVTAVIYYFMAVIVRFVYNLNLALGIISLSRYRGVLCVCVLPIFGLNRFTKNFTDGVLLLKLVAWLCCIVGICDFFGLTGCTGLLVVLWVGHCFVGLQERSVIFQFTDVMLDVVYLDVEIDCFVVMGASLQYASCLCIYGLIQTADWCCISGLCCKLVCCLLCGIMQALAVDLSGWDGGLFAKRWDLRAECNKTDCFGLLSKCGLVPVRDCMFTNFCVIVLICGTQLCGGFTATLLKVLEGCVTCCLCWFVLLANSLFLNMTIWLIAALLTGVKFGGYVQHSFSFKDCFSLVLTVTVWVFTHSLINFYIGCWAFTRVRVMEIEFTVTDCMLLCCSSRVPYGFVYFYVFVLITEI
eukprot:gene3526-2477_t